MFKERALEKILILVALVVLVILIIFGVKVSWYYFLYALGIMILFILSMGMFSFPFSLLYFILSFAFLLVHLFVHAYDQPFGTYQAVTVGAYAFSGFLVYYFIKSIRDEYAINRNFIVEEKQNLEFRLVEYKKNADRKQVLETQVNQLHLLSSMLNKALSYTEFNDISRFFVRQSMKVFPDSVIIFSLRESEKSPEFLIKDFSNNNEQDLTGKIIDNVDEIIQSTRRPFLTENADAEIAYKITRTTCCNFPFSSVIAVPVDIDDKFSGVLKCYGRSEKQYTSNELRILQYISEMMSVLLLNSILYGETEKLARTDGITGLYVQLYFIEKLKEEIFRAQKHNSIFSMLIVDIDDFKSFNDTYGHQVGDMVLVKTSNIIKYTIRSIDFPSRYGGDEFFIILPETDIVGAKILAERIRKKVFEESSRIESEGIVLDRSTSVSIGLAQYRNEFKDYKDFIYKVDSLLYAAKRRGKNCVVEEKDLA